MNWLKRHRVILWAIALSLMLGFELGQIIGGWEVWVAITCGKYAPLIFNQSYWNGYPFWCR